MKTNKVVEFAKKNAEVLNIASAVTGMVIGGAIGMATRKKMYDAGMIKSFWFPCAIKKAGTYDNSKK